jgi:hypothetical protein
MRRKQRPDIRLHLLAKAKTDTKLLQARVVHIGPSATDYRSSRRSACHFSQMLKRKAKADLASALRVSPFIAASCQELTGTDLTIHFLRRDFAPSTSEDTAH